MIDNLGVCKGPGSVLGTLKIGSDDFQISKNGKQYYVLLNNRAILSSKSEKSFVAKSIPVATLMAKRIAKKAGIDQLRWLPTTNPKKDNKMVQDSLDFIQKNLRPAEIFVLQMVPDEIQDQFQSTLSSYISNESDINNKYNTNRYAEVNKLGEYRNDLKLFDQTLENLKYSSDVLLRTNLEKKMWGGREVQDIIHEAKTEMEELAAEYDTTDCMMEHSDDRARIIEAALNRKLNDDHFKKIAGEIIENFSYIKSFISRMAQNLNSIYSIDKDFKSRIGYPATWFFNPSTFLDFTYEYESLTDHLVKMASLETEIIEPLLIWKMTVNRRS